METVENVKRLTKDLLGMAGTLASSEVRYLVDQYYVMQDYRIRAANQVRAMSKSGEPHEIMRWYAEQSVTMENQLRRALGAFAESTPVGRWCLSIDGIGPVITAGLLAHIDINKAPTVGHIWSFAGLDPTRKWEKGQKRPWNAKLKVLCWKIGESFTKVSGKEEAFYGQVYKKRKVLELERNEAGLFADQAAATLAAKKIGTDTVARSHYEQGKLPPARLHLRAQRYACKLFLAHLHHVMHVDRFGTEPPKPYVIGILGHVDYIGPPNFPKP